MASASRSDTFWAFTWYLMNNPHKAHLNRDDIYEMAKVFAAANSTEVTDATFPAGTFTDIEWPVKTGGVSTVTAVGNSSTDRTGFVDYTIVDSASRVTLDQAHWPEEHQS